MKLSCERAPKRSNLAYHFLSSFASLSSPQAYPYCHDTPLHPPGQSWRRSLHKWCPVCPHQTSALVRKRRIAMRRNSQADQYAASQPVTKPEYHFQQMPQECDRQKGQSTADERVEQVACSFAGQFRASLLIRQWGIETNKNPSEVVDPSESFCPQHPSTNVCCSARRLSTASSESHTSSLYRPSNAWFQIE